MASRDSDASLWLHNKLGSTDDLWSGSSICSQLNQERLINIQQCFHTLQPHVKMRMEIEMIVDAGRNDTDQWVSMVADIIKNYPSSGMINTNIEQDDSTHFFNEILADLKKIANSKKSVTLPLECEYLSRSAMQALNCQPQSLVRHFDTRKKPKSESLRSELLQKSIEAANNLKRNPSGITLPIKMRNNAKKMDDTKPMRGLPSSKPFSSGFKSPSLTGRGFGNPLAGRAPTLKKEGGTKLLDMNEMPLAPKEAKRRRRMAEQEAAEQAKKEKESRDQAEKQATPDYAAGLMSPATPSAPVAQVVTVSSPVTANKTAPYAVGLQKPTTSTTGATSLEQQIQRNLQNSQAATVKIIPASTATTLPAEKIKFVQFRQASSQLQTTKINTGGQVITARIQSVSQPNQGQAQQQQTQQKKPLSLTKVQMQEAQEMFKNANKVSRAEKALIIGFMAGCRDNPLKDSNQSVINIMLSEGTEMVKQPDGITKLMGVESYFQMDYKSGNFKRIKKLKNLTAEQMAQLQQAAGAGNVP
ncbi:DgyrCDS10229 [Dimorphilus gyrociliatus]|uniref:DgyrCDS10229 n=1 Tax=Dimorphilus gyrociliatus TaxID=2664684 RepID=A0A7I8W263_9ANNE|nr:DgyrCDS10229 [Dimorphilus gyrociliatus]